MKKNSLAGIKILIFGLLVGLPAVTQAFGVTPGTLEVQNVLPNSEVRTEFYFSRGQPDTAEQIEVSISGSGAQAIKLVDGAEFTLPIGEQSTPYHFVIAPSNLTPGTYSVEFTGKVKNSTSEGVGGNAIQIGALFTLRFTVTNESLESFTIQSVSMGDAEVGQPIGFSFLMNNTGNVDTRPAKIEFTATDELDPSNTYSETFLVDAIPLVAAFSDQNVTLETKASLTPGLYATQIVFYNTQGTVLFTTDGIRLQVSAVAASPFTPNHTASSIWMVYGVLTGLIIILCLFIVHWLKKKTVPN